MADNEIDHIAELQKRLYARDPDSIPKRKFGILRPLKNNIESAWGETEIPTDKHPRRTNVTGYKRFFIFAFFFFLIGLGLALFSFFRGATVLSSKNVDVTILGNSFVGGGEELPVQIEIANKNAADLVNAELTIEYPKGATEELGGDIARQKLSLGTIPSGKTKSAAFTVVLYGEQGTARTITANLTYELAGASVIFQKNQSFSVMINQSPITLTVNGPAHSAMNQPFVISVLAQYNGEERLPGAVARVEYPSGFVFESATPSPVPGTTNVWALGDLERGIERSISIKGRLAGVEGDEKAFRVYLGKPSGPGDNRIAVVYNSTLHTTTISQPFISGTIVLGQVNKSVIALPLGSDISGSITWKNNAPITVEDAIFTLALTGEIDPNTVVPTLGYYNPLDRTIVWTATSNTDLASIEPGATGQLKFKFAAKEKSAAKDVGMTLSVTGTFPDRENVTETVTNIDEKTIRFASRIQFAGKATYSVGPIKNTGPFPPKANQETTYTLTWTMRATDNALTGAIASAVLPLDVTWMGVIAPQGEALNYNPDTRQVSWNIGTLPKATATPQSRSVSFQVKIKPTVEDVENDLILLNETTVIAHDTAANAPLTVTRPELSTRLSTDPAYTPGDEKVLP